MLMPYSCCGDTRRQQLLVHRVVRERHRAEICGHALEGRGGLTAHALDIDRPLGIHRKKQRDGFFGSRITVSFGPITIWPSASA